MARAVVCGTSHPSASPLPTSPHHAAAFPWRQAQYKFLLQLDGHSCSWRLQFLLATNSAVIKQSSYYWEYWYSLLQPYQHFWPFWEKSPYDILPILENVTQPSMERTMRRVGARGSALAHRYLNPHARQCYWRALLELYSNRLQQPPSLAAWPRAQPVATAPREGWHGPKSARGRPRIDWEGLHGKLRAWRRSDRESLRRVVLRVEAELAEAQLSGERLQSDVELRSPDIRASQQ